MGSLPRGLQLPTTLVLLHEAAVLPCEAPTSQGPTHCSIPTHLSSIHHPTALRTLHTQVPRTSATASPRCITLAINHRSRRSQAILLSRPGRQCTPRRRFHHLRIRWNPAAPTLHLKANRISTHTRLPVLHLSLTRGHRCLLTIRLLRRTTKTRPWPLMPHRRGGVSASVGYGTPVSFNRVLMYNLLGGEWGATVHIFR